GSVTITADQNTKSGKLIWKRTDSEYERNNGAVIVYENATGQDRATFKLTDPLEVSLNVEFIPESSARMIKEDADKKPVIGAVLQLLDADDPEKVIREWITTSKPLRVDGLLCEHSYILREKEAPEGYVRAKDVIFQTGKNAEITEVIMTDGITEALKQDADGKTVKGAVLQVLKGKAIIDEWTSDSKPHRISGLTEGEEYVLHEKKAPRGYVEAEDQSFTAQSGRITLIAVNSPMTVYKTDEEGNPVLGAELAVYDTEGNETDRWKTEKDGHRVLGLKEGKKYILKEIKAPFGYEKAKDISFTATEKNETLTMKDKPKNVYLEVLKQSSGPEKEPLEGAEFTVYSHEDDKAVLVLETDENGKAKGSLPYTLKGYYMKETKAPEGYRNDHEGEITEIVPEQEYTFTMDDPAFFFTVEDTPGTLLRIIKKDALSGKTITASSAVFRITDAKGNPVSGDIGTINDGGQKGTAEIAGVFPEGEYHVTEIQAPDGYESLEETLRVWIGDPANCPDQEGILFPETEINDGITVYSLIVYDKPVTGNITVHKTIDDQKADTCRIETGRFDGIEFTLYTKHEIRDPSDGEILFGEEEIYGVYHPDENGKIGITGLPAGEYRLMETHTPDGLMRDPMEYPVLIGRDSPKDNEYTFSFVNKTTLVSVSKKEISGSKEIPGAHLTLKDQKGNLIDQWISGNSPHTIAGLTIGETYILSETLAPAGYYRADEITFTMKNEFEEITMKDDPVIVEIRKIDEDHKAVEGAELCLYEINETGEEHPVEGFPRLSGKDPIVLEKVLKAGKEYVLKETKTPAGYHASAEIRFEIPETSSGPKQIEILMQDDKVSLKVLKQDEEGNPVAGAKISLLEKGEDGAEKELISFTTEDNTEGIDLSGYVEGGKEYVLRETETPYGYQTAEDIVFTVTGKKKDPQVLCMIDNRSTVKVRVEKYDAEHPETKLENAEFEIFDIHTGETVKTVQGTDASGKTDENGIFEAELWDVKDSYAVREKKAPKGYQRIKEVFPVNADSAKMIDGIRTVILSVPNTPKTTVPTSMSETPYPWIGIMTGCAALAGWMFVKLKKDKRTR
ncbi:MAG: hypothetical protein II186_04190, partial [Erysipelotrichales bacterium]|nr:hypothetical protein [Erysipelotrichales bacterium]